MSVRVTEFCFRCRRNKLHTKDGNIFGYTCDACGQWTSGGVKLGEQDKKLFTQLSELLVKIKK